MKRGKQIFVFGVVFLILVIGFHFAIAEVLSLKIVKSSQKISSTQGNFLETLDNADTFGTSVASIGDLDGDGVTDLIVSALDDDDGGNDRGALYILFMNTGGTVKSSQKISDTQGNFLETLDDFEDFGRSVASIGDLNSDGVIDLAVGSTSDDDGGSSRGAVYILFMHTNGTVNTSQKISDTAGNFNEVLNDSEKFGRSVASIGDLNSDGVIDLAVGSDGNDAGGTDKGAVYILFMHTNGTVNTSQKISDTEGNFLEELEDFDWFGTSVASIGDLDGDNITDLAVGAYGDNDAGAGAVYILFMHTNGTVKSSQKISSNQGNLNVVLGGSDFFGYSITFMGDLNGDSIGDVAVGTPLDDDGGINSGSDRGAVYILLLNTNGTVKSSQKISDTEGNFNELLTDGNRFAEDLTSIGDLNGDGVTDLAVGAAFDDDGGTNRGAFYILFLNEWDVTLPTATFTCSPSSVKAGQTVTCTCSGTDSGSGLNASLTSPNKVITTTEAGTFTATGCSVEDLLGNTASATGTYTVTASSSGGGGSSGGSGGGGSSNGGETTTTVITEKLDSFAQITPGAAAVLTDFDRDIGVKEIRIEVNNEVQNILVTVKKHNSKPVEVSIEKSGKTYKYLEIETENLEGNLNKATVEIQVEKSWAEENGLDKDGVAMFKFNETSEEWEELNTVYSDEDDEFYFYDVKLSSFSFFTIGEKAVSSVNDDSFEREQITFIIVASVALVAIIGFLLTRFFKEREK